MKIQKDANRLGTENTSVLLRQFAIPSIISMLVGSLYNIVDQFFIGQSVGALGNAATNIAFPLSISCVAISLLFGIGGASTFNIANGQGNNDDAPYYIGNSCVLLFGSGLILSIFTQVFLSPLLVFFGSPTDVLPLACTYTRITSLGFPFLILSTGGGHLVRADGRPRMTMLCNLIGALINTILDALFVFGFNMGIAGAAYATIIGQIISACFCIYFLSHCKTITLGSKHLHLKPQFFKKIFALGAAPCTNQLSMMIVQIVMNKSLKHYGAASVYGEAIPIACAGIISKVNMIFMSFIIGISQGLQPIVSFNYGAKQYNRVKKAYRQAVSVGAVLAVGAFLMFQSAPRQIISIFGDGSEEYYSFAIKYFRIFLFFTFINFLQPITSNYFTAIGKPKVGIFLSLTRQIIYLLPVLVLFPLMMGIDGIMYAGPFADLLAGITTLIMIVLEFKHKEYSVS